VTPEQHRARAKELRCSVSHTLVVYGNAPWARKLVKEDATLAHYHEMQAMEKERDDLDNR